MEGMKWKVEEGTQEEGEGEAKDIDMVYIAWELEDGEEDRKQLQMGKRQVGETKRKGGKKRRKMGKYGKVE